MPKRHSVMTLGAMLMLGGMEPALCIDAAPMESFRQTIVQAPGPHGPLEGTMLAPAETKAPIVLIVPGSGPTDRNGNGPGGLAAGLYKRLAEGLTRHGIASVRIDKRGQYGSAAAVPDANAVTIADYADDVRTWVATIRRRPGASCVWLLGHSEGALVSLLAARRTQDLCGLILVSAPGRPMGEILRRQLQSNLADPTLQAQSIQAIDALERGEHFDTSNLAPALAPLFRASVQGFLIDAFSYDPVKLLVGNKMPTLILQGQRDLQIGEADARRLAEAAPWARLVLVPEANHVFKAVPPDHAANIAAYSNPSLPLAPGIIEAIAAFVTSTAAPETGPH